MTVTGWCPSCTCGWHRALDAFDVTPPEEGCRNPQCQCHEGFWQSSDLSWDAMDTMDRLRQWGDHESLKRYAYGDR